MVLFESIDSPFTSVDKLAESMELITRDTLPPMHRYTDNCFFSHYD